MALVHFLQNCTATGTINISNIKYRGRSIRAHFNFSNRIATMKHSEDPVGHSVEVIGQGAFGVVWLAEYRGTKVAIKRALPWIDQRQRIGIHPAAVKWRKWCKGGSGGWIMRLESQQQGDSTGVMSAMNNSGSTIQQQKAWSTILPWCDETTLRQEEFKEEMRLSCVWSIAVNVRLVWL